MFSESEIRDAHGRWVAGGSKNPNWTINQENDVVRAAWETPEGRTKLVELEANRVATELNFDKSKIDINTGTREFVLNGRTCVAAGDANLQTGVIRMFANHQGSLTSVAGTMVHEIEHQKFAAVNTAYQAEREKVLRDPATAAGVTVQADGTHIRTGMRADGSLPPELAAKYPLYDRMQPHYDNMTQLAKDDGVTNYSKEYWKAHAATPPTTTTYLAVHETLAEMSRVGYQNAGPTRGNKRLQGVPGTKPWKDFYLDVARSYQSLVGQQTFRK